MSNTTCKIAAPPVGFDAEKFFAGTFWWQRWQMFENVFVPGPHDIEAMCERLGLPQDLGGKRVLDVGAWNGCLTFECERRGAREVIALSPEEPQGTGFYRLQQAIGSTRTRYVCGSIYNLDPEELGYFDTVLCCGVIYHLRYPLLGIDNIRRVCTGELFLETQVCDRRALVKKDGVRAWSKLAEVAPALVDSPTWQFYRLDELCNDCSNWFAPNSTAVVEALESAGFAVQGSRTEGDRAAIHGKIKEGLPEFLAIPCAESVFYDVVARSLFCSKGTKTMRPARRDTLAERRCITEFPVTGVGPDLDELLANQEPIQVSMEEPRSLKKTAKQRSLKKTAKQLVHKVLSLALGRAA